ncbi:MAG: hypothetical protein AAGK97_12705, partial [Bacteroidota bacterium]
MTDALSYDEELRMSLRKKYPYGGPINFRPKATWMFVKTKHHNMLVEFLELSKVENGDWVDGRVAGQGSFVFIPTSIGEWT